MNAVFTLFNFSDLKMHVERKGKKKKILIFLSAAMRNHIFLM